MNDSGSAAWLLANPIVLSNTVLVLSEAVLVLVLPLATERTPKTFTPLRNLQRLLL